MEDHGSLESQKALVFRGLLILAVITVVEVAFALFAKGHIVESVTFGKEPGFGKYLYMLAMIGASLYKAYFIVFFFMHMAYEVRGLVMSVLLPTTLLIWAIIAFFQEGSEWGASRQKVKDKNEEVIQPQGSKPTGFYLMPNQSGQFLG